METRTCETCNIDITSLHGNTRYCKKCAKQRKKEYHKQYIKKYMLQFPKSARGVYYQYYKFLLTLTRDELMALYSSKQHKCADVTTDTRRIKQQITLINEAIKRKEET